MKRKLVEMWAFNFGRWLFYMYLFLIYFLYIMVDTCYELQKLLILGVLVPRYLICSIVVISSS